LLLCLANYILTQLSRTSFSIHTTEKLSLITYSVTSLLWQM